MADWLDNIAFPGGMGGPVGGMSFGQAADTIVPEDEKTRTARITRQRDALAEKQQKILDEMMTTLPQAQADADAQRRAAQGAGAAKGAAYSRAANQPLPDLYKPQYHQVPQPPKMEYREPLKALGNPLGMLAMLGGLFTRNSATTAFNAMAGAMEAQAAGDQMRFKNHVTEFDKALQAAITHNNEEHRAYTDAWRDRKLTWDERMAKLAAETTKYGNSHVGQSAAQGKFDLLNKQLAILEKQGGILKELAPKATAALSLAERMSLEAEKARVKTEGMKELEGEREINRQKARDERFAQMDLGLDKKIAANKEAAFQKAQAKGAHMTAQQEKKLSEGARDLGKLDELEKTWRPEFGGHKTEWAGDLAKWADRKFSDDPAMSTWWANNKDYINPVRHSLFGSALTATEQREWADATFTPADSAEFIQRQLTRRKAIAQGVLNRTIATYRAMGIPEDVIGSALGLPTAAPAATGGADYKGKYGLD